VSKRLPNESGDKTPPPPRTATTTNRVVSIHRGERPTHACSRAVMVSVDHTLLLTGW